MLIADKQRMTKQQLEDLGKRRGLKARPLRLADLRDMDGMDEQWHAMFNANNFNVAKGNGGFVKRENLTRDDINRMPSAEFQWYKTNHAAYIDKILNAPTKEQREATRIKEMWNTRATPEEHEAMLAEVAKFCDTYVQFRGDIVSNRVALIGFCSQNSLKVTFDNLVRAFKDLSKSGQLIFMSVDGEITGDRLREFIKQHPRVLDSPAQVQKSADDAEAERIKNLSSEDFEREFQSQREMNYGKVSAFQRQREKLAVDTFLENNKTSFVNTPENLKEVIMAGLEISRETGEPLSHNMLTEGFRKIKAVRGQDVYADREFKAPHTMTRTNLGGDKPGYPVYADIEKQSLQNKLRTMSAAETAEFFRSNPSARAAIDS